MLWSEFYTLERAQLFVGKVEFGMLAVTVLCFRGVSGTSRGMCFGMGAGSKFWYDAEVVAQTLTFILAG